MRTIERIKSIAPETLKMRVEGIIKGTEEFFTQNPNALMIPFAVFYYGHLQNLQLREETAPQQSPTHQEVFSPSQGKDEPIDYFTAPITGTTTFTDTLGNTATVTRNPDGSVKFEPNPIVKYAETAETSELNHLNSATHYVGIDGTGTPPCNNPNNPCPRIAYATENAETGDSILVASGTYNEALVIRDSRIKVEGGWNSEFTDQYPLSSIIIAIDVSNTDISISNFRIDKANTSTAINTPFNAALPRDLNLKLEQILVDGVTTFGISSYIGGPFSMENVAFNNSFSLEGYPLLVLQHTERSDGSPSTMSNVTIANTNGTPALAHLRRLSEDRLEIINSLFHNTPLGIRILNAVEPDEITNWIMFTVFSDTPIPYTEQGSGSVIVQTITNEQTQFQPLNSIQISTGSAFGFGNWELCQDTDIYDVHRNDRRFGIDRCDAGATQSPIESPEYVSPYKKRIFFPLIVK